jgi:hypothetical protein
MGKRYKQSKWRFTEKRGIQRTKPGSGWLACYSLLGTLSTINKKEIVDPGWSRANGMEHLGFEASSQTSSDKDINSGDEVEFHEGQLPWTLTEQSPRVNISLMQLMYLQKPESRRSWHLVLSDEHLTHTFNWHRQIYLKSTGISTLIYGKELTMLVAHSLLCVLITSSPST